MKRPVYLYVTPFFPTPGSWRGGSCLDMVRALMHEGTYDVRVVRIGEEGSYVHAGVAVTGFRPHRLPCGFAPFLLARHNRRRFLAAVARAGVAWEDVAVCHLHGNSNSYLAPAVKRLNAACRVLLHHHCLDPVRLTCGRLGELPIHTALLRRFFARMNRSVDVQVFCSEGSRRSFSLPFTRSAVYYNGYDPETFRPSADRPRTDRFTIGCIGNFDPLKGQMTLLRALARLKDRAVRTVFIGSGPTLAACRRFVEEHALSDCVEFRSEVDHGSLPTFYRSLDLFVLPSEYEGFGCVFIEALACGVPVIGCRGIGFEEALVAEDREDALIAAGDDAELAERIERVRKSGERRLPRLTGDFTTNALAAKFIREVLG